VQCIDNAVLVILGDGVIKEELEELAVRYKIDGKVFFMNAVSPEEVLSYACSVDIGLCPIISVN